jgi:hypothetical protein
VVNRRDYMMIGHIDGNGLDVSIRSNEARGLVGIESWLRNLRISIRAHSSSLHNLYLHLRGLHCDCNSIYLLVSVDVLLEKMVLAASINLNAIRNDPY